MSIGAVLAEARRQAGMTTTQVSEQTRIRESIIQAIERDDFSVCGADFFARGHIRAIARAIGVDGEPLVREYDSRLGASPGNTAAGVPGPSALPQPSPQQQQRRKRNWVVALLIACAAAVGLITYYLVASSPAGRAAGAAHQPVTAHHAAHKHTAPAPAAVHRGAHRMVIAVSAVSEPCWADLTTRGGATIFEGIIGLGTSRTWTERQAVTLRLGNPGAITLTVDGKRRTGLGSDPVTLSLAPGQRASP